MPVIKCSNGKWKVGQSACIYDTHEKAAEVWAAILAGGNYAAKKVSYDYDGVLSTDSGKEKAKRDIQSGNLVYIISARGDKESMLGVAKDLGIPSDRVYATGSNKAKVEKIISLGIEIHTDNNPDVIKEVNALPKARGVQFEFEETYNDYPESATNNAKRALKWAEENGWGECGTAVGKARANQLANKENISRDTIARMASFKRQQQNKDVPYSEGCGGLMWDAWGGTSGIEWASNKLKQIDKK
jgi:hypothetical protein